MSKRVLILLGIGFLAIIAGIFLLKYELSPAAEKADIEAESIEFDPDIHSDTIQNNTDNSGFNGGAKNKSKKIVADSETVKQESNETAS